MNDCASEEIFAPAVLAMLFSCCMSCLALRLILLTSSLALRSPPLLAWALPAAELLARPK